MSPTKPTFFLFPLGCSQVNDKTYLPCVEYRKTIISEWRADSLTVREIGCCGAYCKTCLKWQIEKYPHERHCRGCKLGYEAGARDSSKAKCRMKVCCFVEKKLETCADCASYPCEVLQAFWKKNGYKYGQYRKQLEFIRQYGYEKYLNKAGNWKRAHGKLTL
jgi:hypothetical protein